MHVQSVTVVKEMEVGENPNKSLKSLICSQSQIAAILLLLLISASISINRYCNASLTYSDLMNNAAPRIPCDQRDQQGCQLFWW